MNVDQGYMSHVRTYGEYTGRTCLTVVHLSVGKATYRPFNLSCGNKDSLFFLSAGLLVMSENYGRVPKHLDLLVYFPYGARLKHDGLARKKISSKATFQVSKQVFVFFRSVLRNWVFYAPLPRVSHLARLVPKH